MKLMSAVVVFPLLFASCAQSVQQIVDEHRTERMNAVYANAPVTTGAADGIGTTNVQAHAVVLTDETHPAGH